MTQQCSDPPQLSDLQLLQFVDGEADLPVINHIKRCVYCRARAELQAGLQNDLRHQFFRQSCPSPDQLRDYEFGLLETTETAKITRHLARCPYCSRELVEYFPTESAETQSDPHWSARLADQVRTWIAQLVPMSGMTPAFAVRGNENQTDAHYSCETASFTIYLETTLDPNDPLAADHTGIGTISGMLVGMIPEGTQVHLWRDGHLVDSAHLDPGGDFRFTALPVGHYAVMINAPMEKIYIPEIALGE